MYVYNINLSLNIDNDVAKSGPIKLNRKVSRTLLISSGGENYVL